MKNKTITPIPTMVASSNFDELQLIMDEIEKKHKEIMELKEKFNSFELIYEFTEEK